MNDRYTEATEWLFEQIPMFQNDGAGAYKPGLERVEVLAAAFGNPHHKIKTIHVAGTNGKGSTSSYIASALTAAGKRTGLFTSPHLTDFRERIRIDGDMISEDAVVDFIDRYRVKSLDIEPSFFELTTVMALDYFARQGVDYAVMEVGLGGRLDSTNIIEPLVSIITNISLDHTALLGDTPAAIAGEKAGIIKHGIPAVIGNADDENVKHVFAEKALREGAPITFAKESMAFDKFFKQDDVLYYQTNNYGLISSPLSGDCQPENVNTALNALKLLPIDFTPEIIADAFRNVMNYTGLRGRWEIVSHNPTVICDTGHNPGGWQYLGPRLAEIASQGDLAVVIGFVNDKDISHILDKLPENAQYYFTQPSVKRRLPVEDLVKKAADAGLNGIAVDDVEQAVAIAKQQVGPDATVYVGGSTFIVADFLKNAKVD